MMNCFWLSTVIAPSVICSDESVNSRMAGRTQFRPRDAMMVEDVTGGRAISSGHYRAPTRCAKWMAIFGSQCGGIR